MWIPILQQMGPSLLVQCDNAIELSKTLVRQWLSRYMFDGDSESEKKANEVTEYLGAHSNFKSHGRCIRLAELEKRNLGLKLFRFDSDTIFADKAWAVYCAVDVIFAATPLYKLFYNSSDRALVRATGGQIVIPQVPRP